MDVLNELQRYVRRLVRLMDACEQYLRDPDDPERYDLTPRAESVIVSYSEPGEGGARIRKNRVLLVKALNGTQVLINWVPSA